MKSTQNENELFWKGFLQNIKGKSEFFQDSCLSEKHWLKSAVGFEGISINLVYTKTETKVQIEFLISKVKNQELFSKFTEIIKSENIKISLIELEKINVFEFVLKHTKILVAENWYEIYEFITMQLLTFEKILNICKEEIIEIEN